MSVSLSSLPSELPHAVHVVEELLGPWWELVEVVAKVVDNCALVEGLFVAHGEVALFFDMLQPGDDPRHRRLVEYDFVGFEFPQHTEWPYPDAEWFGVVVVSEFVAGC